MFNMCLYICMCTYNSNDCKLLYCAPKITARQFSFQIRDEYAHVHLRTPQSIIYFKRNRLRSARSTARFTVSESVVLGCRSATRQMDAHVRVRVGVLAATSHARWDASCFFICSAVKRVKFVKHVDFMNWYKCVMLPAAAAAECYNSKNLVRF